MMIKIDRRIFRAERYVFMKSTATKHIMYKVGMYIYNMAHTHTRFLCAVGLMRSPANVTLYVCKYIDTHTTERCKKYAERT